MSAPPPPLTATHEEQPSHPWHALPSAEVLQKLTASEQGLTPEEAQQRLERYGPNELRAAARKSPLVRFLLQFHNVLIYVLLVAGVVTLLLGEYIDSAVIFGVVIVNALIGFVQEGKAERALEAVRGMLSAQATVVRQSRRMTMPADQIVPGDVVLLQSGDKVPADLRLFRTRELRIDEAVLTGESHPVAKNTETAEEKAVLGDRHGVAFSGTLVTYGQGSGVVVATANHTEIGRISTMLEDVEKLSTPLLRQIAGFGRLLSAAIVLVAAGTFAFGWLVYGQPAAAMFQAAVAVAVAAIPEGLPAIMTITLAIGVQRMAGRNAIIRNLPAVDTLGSVTTICSDKTGTLTRNEMTVRAIITPEHTYAVSGVGYAFDGGFTIEEQETDAREQDDLIELLRAASLCNDASISEKDGDWVLQGDPTEGALIAAAGKAMIDLDQEQKSYPRADAIPFESEHKYMATLHHGHEDGGVIYIKGAPERVLKMCSHEGRPGMEHPIDLDRWERHARELAWQGQRVLAAACRKAEQDKAEVHHADVQEGLTLLGLFGIIDPPRDEAIAAIAKCQAAGIRVKMITGDHALTATVIGDQLNIGDGEQVLVGSELEAIEEQELRDVVRHTDVFARVNPEHKLKLVAAIQANNEVAAMTGDGVNDAPALRRADVGIAMGNKGTEVAKEASDMVLTDDNFASIAHAVEEGRTVYDNLRKAILFILPTNGGQALVIIGAILLGLTHLPVTPVQILWVNMITAVTLALALAFEPSERDVMRRPPRKPDQPLLTRFFLWRISFVSLLLFGGAFGMFIAIRMGLGDNPDESELALARTAAVNALVMMEVAYLFNTRFISDSSLSLSAILGSRYVLIAVGLVLLFQIAFTYFPPAQTLFSTAPLNIGHWAIIACIAIAVFFIVEMEKSVVRHVIRTR